MITINLYEYTELTESAKEIAIVEIRVRQDNSSYIRTVDEIIELNDDVFELPEKYLISKLGEDYHSKIGKDFLFERIYSNRIEYDIEYNKLAIASCLNINNDKMFFKLLEIEDLYTFIEYKIKDNDNYCETYISFTPLPGFDDTQYYRLQLASNLFNSFIDMIINYIKEQYEYQWTRDSIEECLREDDKYNEMLFNIDGTIATYTRSQLTEK